MIVRHLSPKYSATPYPLLLCLFLLLIAGQSTNVAHELMHAEHEPTELCTFLSLLGSTKALAGNDSGLPFFTQSQLMLGSTHYTLMNEMPVLIHPSRGPPAPFYN